jgi:glycosyltransferase involved in cell wall biosynthesis
VHQLKLHKHVRFLGYIPDETLAVLYRSAEVFVFPSLYEGFGLPPLEAMASGTPVVTSNTSSMPEVTGGAAVLVDPYDVGSIVDGVRRVLTDPSLAPSCVARVRCGHGSSRGAVGGEDERALRSRGGRGGTETPMRVALVHDWLTGMRGGEKVLEVLCELFPGADLFTLIHRRGTVSAAIERRRVTTSFVQRLPFAGGALTRAYLPLFPLAIEQFSFDGYDLVVSSSHCAAKAVVVPGRTRHIAYCHSPMRYAWDQFDEYFGPARVGRAMSRWVYRPMLARLARWDAATAPRVHRFVANSRHVAGRIQRYYNRASTVVYPPVDTTFFHPNSAVAPAAPPAASAARRVGAGAVQARGPRHRGRARWPACRSALPATDPTGCACSSRRATT